jgi:hypothetical protein
MAKLDLFNRGLTKIPDDLDPNLHTLYLRNNKIKK